jgi:hypothetical protein
MQIVGFTGEAVAQHVRRVQHHPKRLASDPVPNNHLRHDLEPHPFITPASGVGASDIETQAKSTTHRLGDQRAQQHLADALASREFPDTDGYLRRLLVYVELRLFAG